MTPRRVASITATAALAAGVALVVFVATPSIASVIQTAHLEDSPAAAPSRPQPPAIPSPAPTVAYHGPLIAPTGWADITRAQLHASYSFNGVKPADPGNAAISEQQQWLIKQCMAQRGFLYDPIADTDDIQTLPARERAAFYVTEYGPVSSGPYDWHTAGCHGRAVHLTGQDGAH